MIKKTTEPKRKKKQKFLTVSPSFERKRLIGKFYEGDYENKSVQVPKTIIQAIKKLTGKFLTFFLMKIFVFCKILFWNVIFLNSWSKTLKNTCEGVYH